MHYLRQFRLRGAQLASARSRRSELPEQGADAAVRPRETKLDIDAVRAVQPREEELRAVSVQRRTYDERAVHAALEQQRQRARRVFRCAGRSRLDDELDLRPAPRLTHLLGFRQAAASRPAGEDDDADARLVDDPLGSTDEIGEALGAVMARHDDGSAHFPGTRSPEGTWSRST